MARALAADLPAVALALHGALLRAGKEAGVGEENFATAVLVQLRSRTLSVVSCGHHSPLVVRDRRVYPLLMSPANPPLGLLDGAPAATQAGLKAGDRLLLYSDGVVEARAGGRFFNLPAAAQNTVTTGSLQHGLDLLDAALHRHVGGTPADDVTLLAVELPTPASSFT